MSEALAGDAECAGGFFHLVRFVPGRLGVLHLRDLHVLPHPVELFLGLLELANIAAGRGTVKYNQLVCSSKQYRAVTFGFGPTKFTERSQVTHFSGRRFVIRAATRLPPLQYFKTPKRFLGGEQSCVYSLKVLDLLVHLSSIFDEIKCSVPRLHSYRGVLLTL